MSKVVLSSIPADRIPRSARARATSRPALSSAASGVGSPPRPRRSASSLRHFGSRRARRSSSSAPLRLRRLRVRPWSASWAEERAAGGSHELPARPDAARQPPPRRRDRRHEPSSSRERARGERPRADASSDIGLGLAGRGLGLARPRARPGSLPSARLRAAVHAREKRSPSSRHTTVPGAGRRPPRLFQRASWRLPRHRTTPSSSRSSRGATPSPVARHDERLASRRAGHRSAECRRLAPVLRTRPVVAGCGTRRRGRRRRRAPPRRRLLPKVFERGAGHGVVLHHDGADRLLERCLEGELTAVVDRDEVEQCAEDTWPAEVVRRLPARPRPVPAAGRGHGHRGREPGRSPARDSLSAAMTPLPPLVRLLGTLEIGPEALRSARSPAAGDSPAALLTSSSSACRARAPLVPTSGREALGRRPAPRAVMPILAGRGALAGASPIGRRCSRAIPPRRAATRTPAAPAFPFGAIASAAAGEQPKLRARRLDSASRAATTSASA